MRVTIRRIRADEGRLLMQIRLTALLDAPYAFASSYAESVQRPMDAWGERAARAAAGNREAVFVAEEPRDWLGMVGAYTPRDTSVRHAYGLWVDRSVRRQGLARALMDTVVEWATAAGAAAVTLWVAGSNEPAVALYRQLGFDETGDTQPMPSNDTVTEHLFRRSLDEGR
ncbi:MAG TPA: GNAT family N-acetyltransferase [Acidimicrobiia bacterium]